jgi:Pentapeptide repeats (9 copies)
MGDDSDAPNIKAKMKLEENEWYLLATLFDRNGIKKPVENRIAWNRHFATNLDDETRTALIEEKRYCQHELTPFSEPELRDIKDGATFGWVEFIGHATFDKDVCFDYVTFTGETNFTNAIFAVQSTFVNAKMKYDTSFEGAVFELEPPKFFEAELHESANWNAKKWPLPPVSFVAKKFVDSYGCLKREMDRLKKHEDELDFFALELQSRRELLGRWGLGLPILLYGLVSDYGRSYWRPLAAIVVVMFIGACFFWYFDARTCGERAGSGCLNSFPRMISGVPPGFVC